VDLNVAKNLAKYTAMALTTAATVPISHILIRNHLGQTLGWEVAGYWEAMYRLSGAYLLLISTTLSVYYLPRLSELNVWSEIRQEILYGYRMLMPLTIIFAFMIYIFRDEIISILFSNKFRPMGELFYWQLIGDVLKIAAWLLSFVMLSKAMTWEYISTEVIFSLSFYVIVKFLVNLIGFVGVSVAHAVNYGLYFVVILILVKLRMGARLKNI
jgi:PST family polysaccharide transporter